MSPNYPKYDFHDVMNDDVVKAKLNKDAEKGKRVSILYVNGEIVNTIHKTGDTYHLPLDVLSKNPNDPTALAVLMSLGNRPYAMSVDKSPFNFSLTDDEIEQLWTFYDLYRHLLNK